MGRLLGLAVALIGLGACHQAATAPAYPPFASVKRVASDGASPVEFSLIRSEFRFEADGTSTNTVRDVYKVLSPDAVDDWGEVGARWMPWRMERPTIEATVTTNGKVSRLDPRALSESAAYPEAPAMYGDTRVLRGPLPNVGVGSVVDERVVSKSTRPFVGGSEAHTINFQTGVPREKVELVIDVPESMPIHFEVRDAKVKITDVREKGRRIITFTGGAYQALNGVEEGAPSNVISWPHVSFTTGTDWAGVAKAYAKLVAEKPASPELERAAAGVVASSDAPLEKARKLLAWVHERVRYVGIEFGESGVVPRSPAETLEHGYGDCKDQAVLVSALLRATGVPARVALVDEGYGEDIDASLPALNVFDHAIVVMPGKQPIWIDPTAIHARAGELPAQDQGRYALVVDDDTTGLVRTPEPFDALNTYREVRQVFLPLHGQARVVETSSATGSLERGLRDSFDVSATQRDKWLKDYVSKTYDASEVGSFEMEKVEDVSKPFRMVIEAKNARVAVANLLSASVSAPAALLFSWAPQTLTAAGKEPRATPFALHVPYQAELVFEVHAPAGFVLDEDKKIDLGDVHLGPATLTRKLEQQGGVVTARWRLVVPKTLWTAEEVNAFRKAYEAWGATTVPLLAFEHEGAKLHKARDYDKEIAAYRRDVQQSPGAARPKMRLAAALLDLGFGATARKLANEATKLEPNDVELWNYAGYVNSADTLGGLHKPGWDRDASISAFREALRIEPANAYAATQLAVAYEYDVAGHHYGPGAQLGEAVKVLDAFDPEKLAAFDNGGYVYNAIFDLVYAGRFDEVRARVAKMDAKNVPVVPAIVAAAATGGAVAALSEAERLVAGAERPSMLEAAANVLIRLRRYSEAGALLSAAAAGSSEAQLKQRADIIGKTKRVDVPSMPTATAIDVVRKAVTLCTLYPPTVKDQLKPLVSPRDVDPSGTSFIKAMCDAMGETNANDIPREAFADIVLATLDLRDEGSDDLGHRITLTSPDSSKTSFFVVRDGGSYQLRATSASTPDMGCEALTMQRAGRKAAAVKWLGWARELVTPAGGDDPLRDLPFVTIWNENKDDVELAAASLCAARGRADLTVSTLNAARAKAASLVPAGGGSGARLRAIDHAIALAYVGGGREADRLAAIKQLRRTAPTSEVAMLVERNVLADLGHIQELRDAAAAWLAQAPTEAVRLGYLANAEALLGRFKEARSLGERWIATGNGGATAYNEQAWMGLFVGPTEKDREYALRAVNASASDASYLNTLAALDVALGHTADARDRFTKSIELRKDEALTDADWYVYGRIAERLDLPDEAKAAYAKVSRGEKSKGEYTVARLVKSRAGL